ncbi:MAG: MFS transporter [Proteobacteria bacterium SG_bin7]|nr:MAG: MFS transporter [Proteobacteria bacterium SG_bin7]
MGILVAALGYFVDIFDLYLFGVVRVVSLKDLGVPQENILDIGMQLLNSQMTGLLIGGVLWGTLGDKRGRVSVLFGSIFLYSSANILNGFVTDISTYTLLRFVAGVGLAGELGAAITLVSEILPQKTRGYGTTIVAGVGLSGSVAAAIVAEFFSWRICYFIGGGMGFLLLLLRFQIRDSSLFAKVKEEKVSRGNFFLLLNDRQRFFKYLRLILLGTPIWFVGGLLVTFAPEFGRALGLSGITAPKAIFYTYIGVAIGDFFCGLISQYFCSRKKVMAVFIFLEVILIYFYLYSPGMTQFRFYTICFGLGIATGYWAVLMMTTAEHFGTNLRATVTTSVPNFIRGSVVIMLFFFKILKNSVGVTNAAAWVGTIVVVLAYTSLYLIEETYEKDLEFVEK